LKRLLKISHRGGNRTCRRWWLLFIRAKTKQSSYFPKQKLGTDTVFKATMKDLKGHQISLLETLNDIDTFEDLQRSTYNNLISSAISK
jgi:glycosyltransferase A (GT-A) superfamily protein (DUF2064 family)